MILKKTIIDGKEVFEPISFNDALTYEDRENLVFTSEDLKLEFDDAIRANEEEEFEEEEFEEDDLEDTEEDYLEEESESDYNTEDETKSTHEENDFFNLKDMFKSFTQGFKKLNTKSKSARIIQTLPFLDKEDISELVGGILANSEEYKDLNLVAVMPFVSKEDADKLFMKFIIEDDTQNIKYIYGIAPFVSNDCLEAFVDEYIKGKYQDININALYPFMKKSDVKRVFEYIMKSE